MTNPDLYHFLTNVFAQLRGHGFRLGIGELLFALRLLDGGLVDDDQAKLKRLVQLLWCHSREELTIFETVWSSMIAPLSKHLPDQAATSSPEAKQSPPGAVELPSSPDNTTISQSERKRVQLQGTVDRTATAFGALPVWPPLAPSPVRSPVVLHAAWPIPRHSMILAWRNLHQSTADDSQDQLDVKATVDQVAQQGFFLYPIYQRQKGNQVDLLLMVDRDGSMTPFHRFTHTLVETACEEIGVPEGNIVYFHNVPTTHVYRDPYLTTPVALEQVLKNCGRATSILVISDAGAARNRRRLERIRATAMFLFQVKRQTTRIAWLNPMPEDRWSSTSAQIIAHSVPMFSMDPNGLFSAMSCLSGHTRH